MANASRKRNLFYAIAWEGRIVIARFATLWQYVGIAFFLSFWNELIKSIFYSQILIYLYTPNSLIFNNIKSWSSSHIGRQRQIENSQIKILLYAVTLKKNWNFSWSVDISAERNITHIIQLLKAKLLINIFNNFNNGYEYKCLSPCIFKWRKYVQIYFSRFYICDYFLFKFQNSKNSSKN